MLRDSSPVPQRDSKGASEMKKRLIASAPAEPKPSYTLTGNMTFTTDYRFRGISQTFGAGFFNVGPALQGGIDWAHESGFYLGNWNSNVSGNTFPNGSSIEMDFYGG